MPDGAETVFDAVANGMPGVEMRMPLMMTAVADGRLPLHRVLELCCSKPAESLGIASNKGRLEVGSDADLVIWDMGSEREVRHSALHDRVDYTPYEGIAVMAWPETVIHRGRVVGPDPLPGSGRFLKRTLA